MIPDGSTLAPHHLVWGLFAVFWVAVFHLEEHKKQEPSWIEWGSAVSLFGFVFVWSVAQYELLAILMVGAGLVLTSYGVWRWRNYSHRWLLIVMVLGLLAGWDDFISHTFTIWTPLDAAWTEAVKYLTI